MSSDNAYLRKKRLLTVALIIMILALTAFPVSAYWMNYDISRVRFDTAPEAIPFPVGAVSTVIGPMSCPTFYLVSFVWDIYRDSRQQELYPLSSLELNPKSLDMARTRMIILVATGFPMLCAVPMTIKVVMMLACKSRNTVLFGRCVLLLVNFVAGLLLLSEMKDKDAEERDNIS